MKHLNADSKIKKCSCKHEYQDSKYGAGMRVHTPCKGKDISYVSYKCTVCRSKKD